MKNIRTSITLPLLAVGHSDTNLVDEALLHQFKSNLTKVVAYSPFTNNISTLSTWHK
jgi:hypothetical protein